MKFAGSERLWAVATLEAFAPPGEAVDFGLALDVMGESAGLSGRAGMRLGVWIAAFAPVWMLARPQTIDEVPVELRAELLAKMLSHRVFFVRGLMTFLKLGAAMAIMRVPALRARSNYDRREVKQEAAPRKALPVVGAEVSP